MSENRVKTVKTKKDRIFPLILMSDLAESTGNKEFIEASRNLI
jgi:hypothetical protein